MYDFLVDNRRLNVNAKITFLIISTSKRRLQLLNEMYSRYFKKFQYNHYKLMNYVKIWIFLKTLIPI